MASSSKAERAESLRGRMLVGMPIISGLEVLMGLGAIHFYPDVDIRYWLAGFGFALLSNFLLWLIWLARLPSAFAVPLLPLVPAAIAIISLPTGGFASPWAFTMLGLWFSWTALVQLKTRLLVEISALEFVCFVLALWAGGARPTRDATPVFGMMLYGAVTCVAGSLARDKAKRQLWQALQVQEALKAQLEEQNQERAQKIDELAAQLQNRVRERSLALAKALDGIRAHELAAGSVLDGRIEVLRRLGRGGMGTVYLGRDRVTSKRVAVKLIHAGICDESGIRRFLREAAVVSSVKDPAIVMTNHLDVSEEGQLYQVMDYVEGITLQERLLRGFYPVGPGARICAVIAKALAAAHQVGIVHRDIKPANVMLTAKAPGVRVLDFGISKLVNDTAQAQVTEGQHLIGTPSYMAPEQIRNPSEVTPAADVYSLGVVLFEALTGNRPFPGKSAGAILDAHLHERPPPLTGVPERLATLVARCLDKDPAARPEAKELVAVMTEVADAAGAPAADDILTTDLVSVDDTASMETLDASRQR
jgi:serine/threonine-protein kinase